MVKVVLLPRMDALRQRYDSQIKELKFTFKVIRSDPLATAGFAIVLFFVVIAIFAYQIAPFPEEGLGRTNPDPTTHLLSPSLGHPFGTDQWGRDILSRVLFGTRLSLSIGVTVVLIALAIGAPLGIIAAYYGGLVEEAIMRVTDMFLAFPPILLALVIVATLGRGLENVAIALAVSWWPWYTRILHGRVLSLRSQPFVEAARSLGLSNSRIMFKHIMPSAMAPAIIQASMDLGTAILEASALSFLGLGAQPPTPDWGLMVSEGSKLFLNYPWIGTFPGIAIFLVVLAFNLVGDGVREAIDPRLRRRRLI